jgi:hypothetical protein
MCRGNSLKNGIAQQAGAEATKRRIGHHRHAVPFAPWQEVAFNAAAAEVVKDLIGRAAIALCNVKRASSEAAKAEAVRTSAVLCERNPSFLP